MEKSSVSFFMIIIILLIPINVHAHDPKNYTVLLFEDGPTPGGIVAGILVENDSLFIRNHDTRENVSHRLMVDLDGNGEFGEIDDYSTSWLNSSCKLNETGVKIDENCNAHEMILLSASNGFLQGNISMIHEIMYGDNVTIHEFYVYFGEDIHTPPIDPPTNNEESEVESNNSLFPIILLLFASLFGMVLIIPQLTKTNQKE